MRIHILWAILALIVATVSGLTVYSLLKPTYTYNRPAQPAFVISFDDKYVSEWHAQRELFKRYKVKATFFITMPQQLSQSEIEMLQELAADGHEIASHGYLHENSSKFIKEHGIATYVAHEITPAIQAMQVIGFSPSTFAYPYGVRSLKLDQELTKYFHLLRGDSWKVTGKGIEEQDRIFYKYDGSRLVHGLGIDNNSGVTLQDMEAGFKRAYHNKEAIIIYAHNISEDTTGYSISPQTLEAVFQLAQKHKLSSLTFRELVL
ncbi:polysaccharide deacetylase family protein [Pontibacter sp. HSC-36F09]|uniref:polysaccharide deacetylase family protein n=1 Tax=Pontibacter sp. HSC-36F09 TaxID=2910966 RepID=UPI00209EAF25|nr:polysaccharide deacetylase family protein [Pontibacter sp. HSC-36F09]MCP2042059.1 peptidoglycan/xylan/chitin deacetylase (PgdA/CDA1 family) [Pontibacter sp. HSC-36F09]